MRAMILAAGRGTRMGHLTEHTPKPLLKVAGRYLIEHVISNVKQAGIHEIVINISYHGAQIKKTLGDGYQYGVKIDYSEEPERLEVGGGIVQALPLLGNAPFVVVSGDVITSYDLSQLPLKLKKMAHLVMVDNPYFNPKGDFGLNAGDIHLEVKPRLTFGNIGIYRPEVFSSYSPGYATWRTLLAPYLQSGQVTGEYYQGKWYNVGTPQELEQLNSLHQLK